MAERHLTQTAWYSCAGLGHRNPSHLSSDADPSKHRAAVGRVPRTLQQALEAGPPRSRARGYSRGTAHGLVAREARPLSDREKDRTNTAARSIVHTLRDFCAVLFVLFCFVCFVMFCCLKTTGALGALRVMQRWDRFVRVCLSSMTAKPDLDAAGRSVRVSCATSRRVAKARACLTKEPTQHSEHGAANCNCNCMLALLSGCCRCRMNESCLQTRIKKEAWT